MENFDREDVATYFAYLDNLRASGDINMFGAGLFLRREFLLEREGASAVLSAWMSTFDEDASPEARAEAALALEE